MKRVALAVALACACHHATPAPAPAVASAAPPSATPDAGSPLPLVFLGEVAIQSPLGAALPARLADERPLTLTLHASKPMTSWGELEKRTRPKTATPDAFSFVYDGYPTAHDPPTPTHRKATFVIDFDEPSVVALHARIAQTDPNPSMPSLAQFVDKLIDQKDMSRGFDVASIVATRHEGDCSEHAVLLSALSRSFGQPSRVVLGFAVAAVEGHPFAMGHAWTEYFKDGSWHLADAALPPEVHARYLPLMLLDNEGPGFERAWFDTLDLLTLREIVVE